MRAQSSRQQAQVWSSLHWYQDILPRQFAGQNIREPLSRGKSELRVKTGAPQIAVYNQRLLASVGVGDSKMGRNRRLPLAGSGAGEHNRAQPPFEIRQQDGIANSPYSLFEIGSGSIVVLSF